MTEQQEIGAIGLENLMSRAGIIFTSGYKFQGRIDIDRLQQSFLAIVDCITKFEYQLHSESQDKYHWRKAGPFKNRFLVLESEDIENEFSDLVARSFDILGESNHYPMVMSVILEKNSTDDGEFIIAQSSNHIYTDAGSSEVIFNRVIEYYNALQRNDVQRTEELLEATRQLKTIDTQSMIEQLRQPDFDHKDNVEKLMEYAVADVGDHKVPLEDIPAHLEDLRKRVRKPVIRRYNIHKLIEKCRSAYPEVTKNSAISAVLAKAIYSLNVAQKGKPEEHVVSFKMLSNILPVEKRQQYIGNYISFVPVTINGHESIEDIARDIHERIREFKTTQLNLSLFSLVEDAVSASAVGKEDEEISFIVTNWNNYTFMNNPEFLSGCRSIKHLSGTNIEPRDTLGGALVNRPVLVISLSPEDELCLSFFASIRSDDESRLIAEYIDEVFNEL